MILEIAEIEAKPGMETELEHGVSKALPIFRKARGFISLSFRRSIEHPQRYRLFVKWETLEDHTEIFQQSEGFQQWRALVGHCFADKPKVDHSLCVVES